ncbi:hypothetical protein SARC_09099 [Sphaeroforma arctica JP610]|uniref:Uncharacterized protein n=1 Tax=Sphaeroforma arctica JP610 TaxID=667725 RepID=A0A0L0FR44_9EUKA|nr:hypothetical protein SARC_09099 [Sphaeroforma arctica JP610]KNC78473.1 hypothetical protein SARC_09099 [Sphaeroforma arctica JP610]|eukprot:XP_014152375.1 hypothetical protein SARC_09099 [Sphaeroforma arctica JP610]
MVQLSNAAESMFFFNPDNRDVQVNKVPVRSPTIQRRSISGSTKSVNPSDTMVFWMAKGGLEDVL